MYCPAISLDGVVNNLEIRYVLPSGERSVKLEIRYVLPSGERSDKLEIR